MNDFDRKLLRDIEKEKVQKDPTSEMPKNSLEEFRTQVGEIIGQAEASGRGGHFSDLFDINQLDEKDMNLYARYKALDNTSDPSKFIAELQQEAMALKGSNNGSKKEWISYIINRVQEDLYNR